MVIHRRKKVFYKQKVRNIKTTNPRKWWSMMKKITDKSCGSASGISYATDDANILSGKDDDDDETFI